MICSTKLMVNWNNKKPDDQFKFTDTPTGGLDWDGAK